MEVIFLADFKINSRRRGRPAGKSCISRSSGLCLHDLAFMRAVLQGMNLESAGGRFLPEVHSDLRVIRTYLCDVAQQAQLILQGLGHHTLAVTLKSALLKPQAPAKPRLPSLAEFSEELDDPDAWSEAELLGLYRDRYGPEIDQVNASPASSCVDVDACLHGLTLIQTTGVRLPCLSDDIEAWLGTGLVRHLRSVGVSALSDLTALVRLRGKHWYRLVPGIGKDRGVRLVQWLQDHVNFLEPVMAGPVASSTTALSGWESPTAGALLRATGTNALGAQSDQQALQAWMGTLDFLSPHTRKAYSRDVARLLLWAQRELNKGLSDLTVVDATAHAKFLQNPPAQWCRPRSANNHMTMRGPLSPTSTARAFAAIGHLYGFLVETQYLKANPFSRVRTPHERGVQMDVQRCFSNAHLELIQQVLMAMPSGPRQRRMVAIFALLESTGLRIGEIPSSWAAVVKPFDAEAGTVTCLRVIGKGARERLLPLKEEVLEALHDHAIDQLGTSGLQPSEWPLIGCIGEPVNPDQVSNGALSTARLRIVLKDFFQEVAMACPSPDLAENFRRATPHFMRHTFAHRVLNATQGDLAVTQLLLGHKSISTTGIYVKADLSQRQRAIDLLSVQTLKGAQTS